MELYITDQVAVMQVIPTHTDRGYLAFIIDKQCFKRGQKSPQDATYIIGLLANFILNTHKK